MARHLVDTRVAACVNVIAGVTSTYRWKGVVEQAGEWTLLIKTRSDLLEAVSRELRAIHSYEVPELIAVPVLAGLPEYLAWIDEETRS